MSKEPGSIELMKEHSKIYIGNLLVKMYYPGILAFFLKEEGLEKAKERLYQIGQEVAQALLKIWTPKTKDIKTLVKGLFKKIWKKNVKVSKKKDKYMTLYRIIDKSCGFCDPETTVEGLNIPCVTIDGYIDAFLQDLSKRTLLPSYKIHTVKSVSVGDDYCEHHIELAR